ncbi:Long-chain-fatty-acid--CoA ligase [uncultured Gammaproteobacteria bacterium]
MSQNQQPAPPWLKDYPDAIDWRFETPHRPLAELLDDAVAKFPHRPCLDFLGKHMTYGEVGEQVARIAKGFQDLGIGKGDRVGLFLPNTPYFIIAYYAALKVGATVVNYNPLYAEKELIHQIEDSGTETMVTLDVHQLYDKLAPLLGTTRLKRLVIGRMVDILPFTKKLLFPLFRHKDVAHFHEDAQHICWNRLLHSDPHPAPVAIDPDHDVAVLQYTGGTTGLPKGAMLTHTNLWANATQCGLWFAGAREGEDRMLGVLPLFHVFAMTVVMNLGIRIGAELLLIPRFEISTLLKTIHDRRPTLFPAVPTVYSALITSRDRSRYDMSSIRYCISGGAPLPLEVKQGFERATGCNLVEGYGLTESSPVAVCNPLGGLNKPGSIGLPLPGTTVEIVNMDDRETLMPFGERGELCLRGPQVMAGYWNKADETADVLRNGRLHTGDIAYMDADGFTFIVDRIKDMILCGGFNVYPRNIEDAIYQHPAVDECVVAGIPDGYRGQTVKAFIKLKEGTTLDQPTLNAFLKDKLSSIELPKRVEFRESLPRTMVGKLSRKQLLDEELARRNGQDTA